MGELQGAEDEKALQEVFPAWYTDSKHALAVVGADEDLRRRVVESDGELRAGAYQELARGSGVRNYAELLESGRASETRVRTAPGFGKRGLGGAGFGGSLVRTRSALFVRR